MEINILHLIEGARKAKGLTVIIDVFRAFTTACYIMNNHAQKIIVTRKVSEALNMKKNNSDYILVGEKDEKKPQGFDFGNSPSHVKNMDFNGKTVVQTTTAGTNGIVNATLADEIITGSFVNIDAIVQYIKQVNPPELSLVCMGYRAKTKTDEDTFCAEYIQAKLEEKDYPIDEKIKSLKQGAGKRFFLEKNQPFSPSEDFYLCTTLNQFNFVIKAIENTLYIHRMP